jgi:putative membrane protein
MTAVQRCSGAPRGPAAAVALLALLVAGCAPLAAPPPAPAPLPQAAVRSLDAADREFMTRTASNWLYELEVSRLAARRAVSPSVRAYAERLASQHALARGELSALMRAKGVAVAAGLPADKTTKLHRLSALQPGSEFDLGYVRVLGIENHRTALADFEAARRDVRDPELQRWIDRMLPLLRERLAAAQKLTTALSS